MDEIIVKLQEMLPRLQVASHVGRADLHRGELVVRRPRPRPRPRCLQVQQKGYVHLEYQHHFGGYERDLARAKAEVQSCEDMAQLLGWRAKLATIDEGLRIVVPTEDQFDQQISAYHEYCG